MCVIRRLKVNPNCVVKDKHWTIQWLKDEIAYFQTLGEKRGFSGGKVKCILYFLTCQF